MKASTAQFSCSNNVLASQHETGRSKHKHLHPFTGSMDVDDDIIMD
jgi:hypothetical protein